MSILLFDVVKNIGFFYTFLLNLMKKKNNNTFCIAVSFWTQFTFTEYFMSTITKTPKEFRILYPGMPNV